MTDAENPGTKRKLPIQNKVLRRSVRQKPDPVESKHLNSRAFKIRRRSQEQVSKHFSVRSSSAQSELRVKQVPTKVEKETENVPAFEQSTSRTVSIAQYNNCDTDLLSILIANYGYPNKVMGP